MTYKPKRCNTEHRVFDQFTACVYKHLWTNSDFNLCRSSD